jgi:hypothetical protein
MITYERRGDTVTVKCSIDGKVLAVINEDTGKGWDIADCSHYKWERISVQCYYDSEAEPDICQPEDVKELKQRQLLRIDDGDYFLILIPKGEEE